MSLLGDIESTVIAPASAPWIVAISLMVLAATGGSGLYFGALIERGRSAKEISALKDEQIRSITFATELWKQSQARSDMVSGKFEDLLKNIKVENKTVVNEVKQEVQREVYIDCKLPDSGIDLLRRQVNMANTRIIEGPPPAPAIGLTKSKPSKAFWHSKKVAK
jgi:hypothetical protein